MGVGGRKSQNHGLVTDALFFLLPSSCASRKMPRLHRLVHKAPVMQACVECSCTARQIVASSCIKVSKQHHYRWAQRPKCSFSLCEKCLLLVIHPRRDEMFTADKSRPILLMQILDNAVKRLIFFKCQELS